MPERGDLQNHFYLTVPGFDAGAAADLMGDLVDVTVESSLHLPDVATVVLHDARLRWVDDRRLDPGTPLKVSAKGAGGERPVFDGEIVELEPEFGGAAQRLTVRAFDRLHRLTRGAHARSFLNVSDGDLVAKLAREARLEASAAEASQVHPYVFQNNESNLAFLRARAAQLGFLLYADGRTVHFEPPKADGAAVELKWGETLLDFRPRLTTAAQVTGSTVRGWDPAARQPIVGQAAQGRGRPEVGEARSGEQLARSAFEIDAPVLTVDRPIRTQAAADRLAQAVADRHASRYIEADGTAIGTSAIVAGSSVRLANVGARFSGTYFVTGARHVYTADAGYTTHFSVSGHNPASLLALLAPEPAGVPTSGVVIGVVTDNDDPEGLGRVRVKYPWLTPDHASDWARVLVLGGGPGRGFQFVPEVNDEVLVAFELGDVHHPYVLGGLWNGRDKPPGEKGKVVSGGKVQQRVIRSRAGHTVTLDDSDGAPGIVVEDKNGNVIRIDSAGDRLTIRVKGDAAVEAKGKLTLAAQGPVEIKGNGVKVDGGGGTVDVTGSVINLN
jgi:phage protein D